MSATSWLDERDVLAIHDEQLAEHGGLPGLRDRGALLSALARPQNLAAYGDPDLSSLAAAYAYGLARNHAFADGNKRIAFVAMYLFLRLHDHTLTASDEEAVTAFLGLAAGDVSEDALAHWICAHIRAK